MKVGDAVKFIGFKEHPHEDSNLSIVGIIVKIHEIYDEKRYDVVWPNGCFGNWLFPETLELVSESR